MPSMNAMVPPLTPGMTSAVPMQNPWTMVTADFFSDAAFTGARRNSYSDNAVESLGMVGGTEMMHSVHEHRYVFRIDGGVNAMAQIEDVSVRPAVAFQ